MEQKKKTKLNKSDILKLIICVIFTLSVFILIAWGIGNNKIESFDNTIYNMVHRIESPFMTSFFKIVTFLCDEYFMIVLVVLLFLVIKNKGYPITLALNLIGVAILNKASKYVFVRQRPLDINLINETGYSFPSGHSMASFAFYGYVIYLIYKNIENKWLKWISISLFSVIILLIGTSRIYLGVHFASDVIGGFLLAYIYLLLFITFVKINIRKKNKEVK